LSRLSFFMSGAVLVQIGLHSMEIMDNMDRWLHFLWTVWTEYHVKARNGTVQGLLLINWLEVRVLSGSQLEPVNDIERFLGALRFDSREKVQDMMKQVGN
jgi:hypothetical protein